METKINELRWEITSEENKERFKNFIFGSSVLIIGIIISSKIYRHYFSPHRHLYEKDFQVILKELFIIILAYLVGASIFLLINKFVSYKNRKYILANDYLEISKGNKTKKYTWDEFNFFYNATEPRKDPYARADVLEERQELSEIKQEEVGITFYLRQFP
jgi:ATP/ADP translocase